jgi:hypothetical protein
MNSSDFAADAPGTLVPIAEDGARTIAFVPVPVPRHLVAFFLESVELAAREYKERAQAQHAQPHP